MSIAFNGIPTSLRVPFTYVEFDNSNASQGPSLQPWSVLCMGQKLVAGAEAELGVKTITSEAQAITAYGRGSMLHLMVRKYLLNNKVTELKVIAIDDAGAGVAADGSLLITAGTATADGTLQAYVGGQRISVAVSNGDDQDAVATALVAAVNLVLDLPVTALIDGVNAFQVNLTARNKGLTGNEIDLRFNLYSDDAFPAGIVGTTVAMASGATNPDITDIIAVLPEDQYNLFINPWTDAANLALLETELALRSGPTKQIDGVSIAYKMDSLSNLQILGNSRNSQFSSITGPGVKAPSTSYEYAAAKAAQMALSAQADPARPFQTLPLLGIIAPSEADRFSLEERNILLSDGIATDRVSSGGLVQIERVISTYQTNAAGAPDVSFLDVNTTLTLSYLRYDFRTQMQSKFPRHKLANDGTRFGAGQPILTPSGGKAEAVRIFSDWELLGLVEGLEQFKKDIIVERNSVDATRLDFLLPPNLMNQLRILSCKIQFLL